MRNADSELRLSSRNWLCPFVPTRTKDAQFCCLMILYCHQRLPPTSFLWMHRNFSMLCQPWSQFSPDETRCLVSELSDMKTQYCSPADWLVSHNSWSRLICQCYKSYSWQETEWCEGFWQDFLRGTPESEINNIFDVIFVWTSIKTLTSSTIGSSSSILLINSVIRYSVYCLLHVIIVVFNLEVAKFTEFRMRKV